MLGETRRVVAWSGFGGCPSDFAGLRAALERTHPQLAWHTPWLPGHGPRSAAPGACGIPALTQTLLAEAPAALQEKPPILLGYSLGGRLALASALADPHRWSGVVLLSASPGLPESTSEKERQARIERDDAWAERLRAIATPTALEEFFEEWWSQPVFVSPTWTPTFYRRHLASRRVHCPTELATLMAEASVGRQASLWSQLGRLTLPVLLLAGGVDEKFCRYAEEMQRLLPRAEVRILPGAGHSLLLENPPTLAPIVAEWMDRHFGRSGG